MANVPMNIKAMPFDHYMAFTKPFVPDEDLHRNLMMSRRLYDVAAGDVILACQENKIAKINAVCRKVPGFMQHGIFCVNVKVAMADGSTISRTSSLMQLFIYQKNIQQIKKYCSSFPLTYGVMLAHWNVSHVAWRALNYPMILVDLLQQQKLKLNDMIDVSFGQVPVGGCRIVEHIVEIAVKTNQKVIIEACAKAQTLDIWKMKSLYSKPTYFFLKNYNLTYLQKQTPLLAIFESMVDAEMRGCEESICYRIDMIVLLFQLLQHESRLKKDDLGYNVLDYCKLYGYTEILIRLGESDYQKELFETVTSGSVSSSSQVASDNANQ